MIAPDRDPGLDTLLDLHGQTLFVDEAGHWVKFVVVRTEVTPERPHGLSYSLTLHAPDGRSGVTSVRTTTNFTQCPASSTNRVWP